MPITIPKATAAQVTPIVTWLAVGVVGYLILRAITKKIGESGGLLAGAVDVITGAPKPAEIETLPDAPTHESGYGLFVYWIAPKNGGEIDKYPWQRSYPVTFELENSGSKAINGVLSVEVFEEGFNTSTVVTTGPLVTIAPHSRKLIKMDLNSSTTFSAFATPIVRVGQRVAIGGDSFSTSWQIT